MLSTSGSVQVPVDELRTRKVLETYSRFFSSSPLTLRLEVHPGKAPALSVRYLETMRAHTPEPLTTAVLKGYVSEDTSPLFALFEEMKLTFDILGYGVNLDVSRGITRLSAAFVPIPVETILTLEHLPKSLKQHLGFFKKHGLTRVAMLEYDFAAQLIHVFVMVRDPSCVMPGAYRSLLSDLNFDTASDAAVSQCARANMMDFAFSWQHDECDTACFSTLHPQRCTVPSVDVPLIEACLGNTEFFPRDNQVIFSHIFSASAHSYLLDSDFGGAISQAVLKVCQAGI